MNINGLRVAHEINPPDFLKKLIATPDALGILNKQLKNYLFLGGKIEINSITGDSALVDVKA